MAVWNLRADCTAPRPVGRRRRVGPLVAAASVLMCTAFAGVPAERKVERVGTFLVASSQLLDPRFRESVVLITQHNELGTAGVIVNRPTNLTLASAFPHNPALKDRAERLYFGGPVSLEDILFLVRSPEKPRHSTHVFEDVYLSADFELLDETIAKGDLAGRVRVFAGYAGWAPGQLREEIARGDWYTAQADVKAVFGAEPAGLWQELIDQLTGHWVRRGVGGLLL